MSTSTQFTPDSLVTFLYSPHDDRDGDIDYDRRIRIVGRIVECDGPTWLVETYASGETTFLPDREGMGNSPQHRTYQIERMTSARVLPIPDKEG